MLEPPRGDERVRLVGDLIARFFTAYAAMAESRGEAFVPLDDGLSIMSKHAKGLGYDAVILFLDELILWLASRAADVAFVSSEGTKLVKLVEATHAERPIPLVSFVARQRDLRDLVGENLAGALQLQFADVLKHWEARFHVITLEDRNLPAIAEKRVLRPGSESARQVLQSAFEEFLSVRREVLETLLTSTADRELFRQVYPFSPALVQALIAVSSVLQRERTALKLMLQLLVDRREDLELGEIIPVGDLYDVIAEGDEPFSEAMRVHFENAKRLYNQKLLPLLERSHGVTWQAIKSRTGDPVKIKSLKNDARLLKTLLLAALVPEVESLKGLTAQRLAALNHGTVRSPIPGREAQDVLRKCRDWAAEVGELKVAEDTNPVISIQVTGVDIEPIIESAEAHDNPGNRRRKLRELLFEQLGIEDTSGLFTPFRKRPRSAFQPPVSRPSQVRYRDQDGGLEEGWPEIERAIEAADGWVLVQDRALRQLIRSIANPLRLGEMGETHFVLGQQWKTHFMQCHARDGGAISVAKLRGWIDAPQPMGLPSEVQNLIILTLAGQTNRSFVLNGGPYPPTLENLPNELELREQALPSKEDWDRAIARAAGLFGLTVPQTLNAANVAKLVDAVLGKVKEDRPAVDSLAVHLHQRIIAYAMEGDDTSRIRTARSAQALLAALANADRGALVSTLAHAPVETSEAAMAQTLGRARALDEAVRTASWPLFEAVASLADHRKPAARAIAARFAEVLSADEHVIALKPALDEQQAKALKLLTDIPPPQRPPSLPTDDEPECVVVKEDKATDLDRESACSVLAGISRELDRDADLRLSLAWKIVRKGKAP